MVTTIDEEGRLRDSATSGLTPEQRREMVGWPDGSRLFEHLRDLPAPIRLEDCPGYPRPLGLSNPTRSKTMHGASPDHRGGHIGHFFLSDTEDGEELTGEDEEIPMLFAAQAATAVTNARRHLDVQLARVCAEGMIETSPFGAVVLEAGTGHLAPVKREAQRIVEAHGGRIRAESGGAGSVTQEVRRRG